MVARGSFPFDSKQSATTFAFAPGDNNFAIVSLGVLSIGLPYIEDLFGLRICCRLFVARILTTLRRHQYASISLGRYTIAPLLQIHESYPQQHNTISSAKIGVAHSCVSVLKKLLPVPLHLPNRTSGSFCEASDQGYSYLRENRFDESPNRSGKNLRTANFPKSSPEDAPNLNRHQVLSWVYIIPIALNDIPRNFIVLIQRFTF
ncbi:hypothetical protein Tco_0734194 [Tanacetum coccineum]